MPILAFFFIIFYIYIYIEYFSIERSFENKNLQYCVPIYINYSL